MSHRVFGLALAAAALAAVQPASAQQQQPGPDFELGGPKLPGVCVFDREALLTRTKLGAVVLNRLGELSRQSQDELAEMRKPLDAELQKLDAESAKPGPDYARRRATADEHADGYRTLVQIRNQEMQMTREKQFKRVADESKPLLTTAYKANGCGLLLDAQAVLGGAGGLDLTAEVVKGMDAKIATVSFEREMLPLAVLQARQ